MQFSSFPFFIFLLTVILISFWFPKYRWVTLLLASLFFCFSFSAWYLAIFSLVVLFNYLVAFSLEKPRPISKLIFLLGIISNVGVLGVFKYTNFVLGTTFDLVAPVGISFLTLQSISYLAEVRAGRLKPEHHIGHLALYFLFFPKLVSGPIERPEALLPQFKKSWSFDEIEASNGLKRIAWGFFKKLVVADRLAPIVTVVFSAPESFMGSQMVIATFLFSIQIYFDFAGYTDIAIGVAQILGVKLSENFKQPYLSASVTEFWQRWHISFSNWLRDYIYYPLARRIHSPSWRWVAILATFLISGLWHGAAWTFVIWGLVHGIYLAIENAARNVRFENVRAMLPNRFWKNTQITLTFTAISAAWIFFRAETLGDAFFIFANLPAGILDLMTSLLDIQHLKDILIQIGFGLPDLVILAYALLVLFIAEILQNKTSLQRLVAKQTATIRWVAYYILISSILFLGVFGQSNFIYFQF